MYYGRKLNNLNILIKAVIELNNKFYKLIIKLKYNKVNSKTKPYFKYTSNYNKQIQTNE